ncbi:uncharacterized protein LOC130015569 [Mercurialis annua]|uniref:uncharacterized protein LOC130015569 n=1 Tax=Mercurialis annua TaxID=3986 RepID=UPI0024AE53FC|nr:uncharacterized protein LOC130015569 [Mercurialis annua]
MYLPYILSTQILPKSIKLIIGKKEVHPPATNREAVAPTARTTAADPPLADRSSAGLGPTAVFPPETAGPVASGCHLLRSTASSFPSGLAAASSSSAAAETSSPVNQQRPSGSQQVSVLKQLHRAEPTVPTPSAAAACLQQFTPTASKVVSNPTTMAGSPKLVTADTNFSDFTAQKASF